MTQPTWCRICESACGLLATVEDGRVTALRPDPEHPLSRGYACVKGTRFLDVHDHPDRVTAPLVRREGRLVATRWDLALAEIGGTLRRLRAEHGPASIGLYLGNAAGHSLGAVLGATGLARGLGTKKTYSCLTLDNSVMFVVTEACLGSPLHTFVADYAESDCIALFGTDPLSSQPSQAQSHPGGVRELHGKAGVLTVVDPRRSATAARARWHIQTTPGEDVALLAFLVRAVLARRRPPGLGDLDALAAGVARFDRAPVEVHALAERLLAAERPLVWSGLGVLLGPDGTLGYWLTLALQAVLGGIERAGGWRHQRGAVDLPRLFARIGVPGSDPRNRSRVGGYPAVLGTHAAATLADDILVDGADRLRALVVVGGNPAVSLPDSRRAIEALRSLDLLVTIDLFANETGQLAHAVLPAADWLERPDSGLHMSSQRHRPHLQVTRGVVPPRGQARPDGEILTALGRSAGVSPFGSRWLAWMADPLHVSRLAVTLAAPFRWAELAASSRGLLSPPPPPRPARVDLAIPAFLTALADWRAGDAPLRLLTSVRPMRTMNTWLHDAEPPVARVHPSHLDGARVLGLIASGRALDVAVIGDPSLQPGVVVLPFGYGAANPNVLIGTERLEVFTGQPVSNGAPVSLRIERAGASTSVK